VHVQRAARRERQQRRAQQLSIIEAEQEFRRQRADARDDAGIVGVARGDPADAEIVRDIGDALEPLRLRRVVVVRDDERHVDAVRAQHAQATRPDIVVAEYDGAGARIRHGSRLQRRRARRQRRAGALPTSCRAGTSGTSASRSSTARTR
jgi:hypothetical protein